MPWNPNHWRNCEKSLVVRAWTMFPDVRTKAVDVVLISDGNTSAMAI